MVRNTCAFTGHRPKSFSWKYDESNPGCVLLKEVLTVQIRQLAEQGVTDFLSGMAQGTDLWCAKIVLALQKENPSLKLHCILPCREQTERWKASERETYRCILEQADSIVYVNRHYSKNCMQKRNRFMVDWAGILLAVYNGTCRSGTGMTVRYAQKLGREIIVIDPAAFPTY